jgi:hypothetical protein
MANVTCPCLSVLPMIHRIPTTVQRYLRTFVRLNARLNPRPKKIPAEGSAHTDTSTPPPQPKPYFEPLVIKRISCLLRIQGNVNLEGGISQSTQCNAAPGCNYLPTAATWSGPIVLPPRRNTHFGMALSAPTQSPAAWVGFDESSGRAQPPHMSVPSPRSSPVLRKQARTRAEKSPKYRA